jgi:hypothetical protein
MLLLLLLLPLLLLRAHLPHVIVEPATYALKKPCSICESSNPLRLNHF